MSKQEAKGIAAGLLFAAVLLTAYYFMFSQAKAEENEVTDAMVKQHLEEKGMVMVAKEEYESLKEAEKPVVEQERETQDVKKEDKPEEINFTIKEGMTSQEVAQSLQDQKLVKKSNDFIKTLRDMDKEMAVQPGDYTLNTDMSSADIVEEITR